MSRVTDYERDAGLVGSSPILVQGGDLDLRDRPRTFAEFTV